MPRVRLSVAPVTLASFGKSDVEIIGFCRGAVGIAAIQDNNLLGLDFWVRDATDGILEQRVIGITANLDAISPFLFTHTGAVGLFDITDHEQIKLLTSYAHPEEAKREFRALKPDSVSASMIGLGLIWDFMVTRFELQIFRNLEATLTREAPAGLAEMVLRGYPKAKKRREVIPWSIWNYSELVEAGTQGKNAQLDSKAPRTVHDFLKYVQYELIGSVPKIHWTENKITCGDQVWCDVNVEFVGFQKETPTDLKKRRIEECRARLRKAIKDFPSNPPTRRKLTREAILAIHELTAGEFDVAWRREIPPFSKAHPTSPWGKPGRPRNVSGVSKPTTQGTARKEKFVPKKPEIPSKP